MDWPLARAAYRCPHRSVHARRLPAALVYARSPDRKRYALLSGLALGLAVLTKSYGVLVGPVVALFWLVGRLWRLYRPARHCERSEAISPPPTSHQGRNIRTVILFWARDVTLWAVVAGATFVLAWPAMWVAPFQVLQGVLGLSLEYATRPGDATTAFFRGQVVADPGAVVLSGGPLVPRHALGAAGKRVGGGGTILARR